jgi:hypothetical protein
MSLVQQLRTISTSKRLSVEQFQRQLEDDNISLIHKIENRLREYLTADLLKASVERGLSSTKIVVDKSNPYRRPHLNAYCIVITKLFGDEFAYRFFGIKPLESDTPKSIQKWIRRSIKKVAREVLGSIVTVKYSESNNSITIMWAVEEHYEFDDEESLYEEEDEEEDKDLCVACNTNKKSIAGRCGHLCVCSSCSDKLLDTSKKCPMCRAPWTDPRVIYF